MKLKAIIFDLDNTIYSVYSIGDKLFEPLFNLFQNDPDLHDKIESIKKDIMRKPFQKVASEYQLSETLIKKGFEILKELTADMGMTPFEDYISTKQLDCDKFLVTVGFTKMQEGKVKNLGIKEDFNEIYIIDPQKDNRTKKEVFAEIMERHQYQPNELIVVGDDPNSEIQAAKELGIKAILYDKLIFNSHRTDLIRITDYQQLIKFIEDYE
ncbi:HAD family hydrolase [Labilibaculum antarcticum]|uniref:Haloacid dehalogenase n=1 Tax=Labilibaculum antarcticum TaxID=1717717 RepID=A0A1Y1CNL9_9BACT|nr:HAD family hydrolase [Labilibaculum antarcticum]BAX81864.1 haloacid dehalogenase [Labilibaculum antarcticum]